jgi:hypothetical protein
MTGTFDSRIMDAIFAGANQRMEDPDEKKMSRATLLALAEYLAELDEAQGGPRFGALPEPMKIAMYEEAVHEISWLLFGRYELRAEERVIVAEHLLEEAKESARLVKTKWLGFVHEVDAAINVMGTAGKKEAVLAAAFNKLRESQPDLRGYPDKTLERYYYREKEKQFVSK